MTESPSMGGLGLHTVSWFEDAISVKADHPVAFESPCLEYTRETPDWSVRENGRGGDDINGSDYRCWGAGGCAPSGAFGTAGWRGMGLEILPHTGYSSLPWVPSRARGGTGQSLLDITYSGLGHTGEISDEINRLYMQ